MIRSWKRQLRAWVLPSPTMSPRQYLRASATDAWRWLRGANRELLPPARLMFDGSQSPDDFRRDGDEFLRYFVELGGLAPHHRVLEIGCAIGRKALPLTRFLDERGSYDGFDIVGVGIDWCQRNVTPRFPRFRFQRADVYNALYHERGRFRAAQYRFPFDDARFEFAFATSVFTHMLPDDLANYVRETARVLATGGRCLASFLLLDDAAQRSIDAGQSPLTLRHPFGACRTESAEVREAAVGYAVPFVRETFAAAGLRVIEPIRFGSWSGRAGGTSFQDIVVAEKA